MVYPQQLIMEWTLVDDIVSKLYSYHVVLPEIYENLNALDKVLNFKVLFVIIRYQHAVTVQI